MAMQPNRADSVMIAFDPVSLGVQLIGVFDFG